MKTFDYPLNNLSEFEKVVNAQKQGRSCQVTGCSDSELAHFISGLGKDHKQKVIVTFSARKMQELYDDLRTFCGDVVMYPSKDLMFYNSDIHGNLIEQQRLDAVRKILEKNSVTIVLTAEAFMDRILPIERIRDNHMEISKGSIVEIDALRAKLSAMGYERQDQVQSPGQFSVRGSVVDIYTLTDEVPYRIDFWDNEVDLIKSFDPESQRSIENLDSVKIYPGHEYLLTEKERENGLLKIREELENTEKKYRAEKKDEEAKRLCENVTEFLEHMEIDPSGAALESYVNYFYDRTESFFDYLDDAAIYVDEPKRVIEHLKAVEEEFYGAIKSRLEKGYILPGQADLIYSVREILERIDSEKPVFFTAIAQKISGFRVDEYVEVDQRGVVSYNKNFDLLAKDLKKYSLQKYSVVLATPSASRGRRLAENLKEFDIDAVYSDDPDREAKSGEVIIINGILRKGFLYPMIKFIALSDSDMFGEKRKKRRRRKSFLGTEISSFSDLSPGDYVVHENHGIGIYEGIEKVEVDRAVRDYIKIKYAGDSNLFMLATQLDMIQKYADKDAKKIKLSVLGDQKWSETKNRVKKAVETAAKELVELYAERMKGNGFTFSEDTEWQKEFEELFPFEETEDQLAAIRDVKRDMESSKIMDRLICGDVGFGKTEIAIRAAFKAIQDSKQVAYLVPTTVLAQQHYKTFSQRFKDFPVRIEMMSRFRSSYANKKTAEEVNEGYVDILIGTHRMLSSDVRFRDLGLLVIDEEQRFGVKHKEKIKELKKNVDVITLTATPIPRTLHMSLVGIRDLSVMEQPPQDRMPIQTFVMEYDGEIVREAISREMARGGQVFYIYNRISGISEAADMIRQLVPEAEVAYIHSRMSERQTEDTMYDFVNGDIDVLVSTTIVETGLDIPNANTIIIQGAERMGLSQLYQLRGRVGRSSRTAYAFLMYGRNKMISEVAEKRLEAIRNFTELGSGVKIAMRDLEIRGAGNVLGVSQSGHIAEVGYDLYCKMLNEAIALEKGRKAEEDFETKVELSVKAYIPAGYIANEALKMEIYQRIAGIETVSEYEDMQDELMDRFGEIPDCVDRLLLSAMLKNKAHRAYVSEISGSYDRIRVVMWKKARIDINRIPLLIREYRGKLQFYGEGNPYFIYMPEYGANRDRPEGDLLKLADQLVEDLSTLRDEE